MTTQNDEAQRVRSYLLSQGEKYAFTELWPRLIKARLEVIAAAEGVSQGAGGLHVRPQKSGVSPRCCTT